MNKRLEESDEDLMVAYQNGTLSAFDELYKRYANRVYGFLVQKNLAPAARDDLFQEIFLKLHKSREIYSPRLPFAPWLFTISRSVVLDHFKAKKPVHEDIENQVLSSASDPALNLNLNQAFRQISESQREALKLRFQEGLDFSEISRRLKTSPSNVRQLISRALKKIRGQS